MSILPISAELEPITAEAATAWGFAPITTAFSKKEAHLLENMIAGLRGKSFRLVSVPGGAEVWRLKAELNTIQPPSVISFTKIHAGGASL